MRTEEEIRNKIEDIINNSGHGEECEPCNEMINLLYWVLGYEGIPENSL